MAMPDDWHSGFRAGQYDYRNNIEYDADLYREMADDWHCGYAAGHSGSEER